DRIVVADIYLDAQGGPACRLNLGDRTRGSHVLRLGLEFLVRSQVQVGHRDLGSQHGEPFRVSPSPRAAPVTIATFPSSLPMMVPFCVRVLPLPVMPKCLFLARQRIETGSAWSTLLISPVAFRPGNHIRDIERPHDLETLEHGKDIVVEFESFPT